MHHIQSATGKPPFFTALLSLIVIALLTGCSNSKTFTGYSYDPEGVTNTKDKTIYPQHRRTIGIQSADSRIWISNEFEGARMNDFFRVSDSLYQVTIEPENHPINNSPWYAFKIWSDTSQSVSLRLDYNHGRHRYLPKLSRDGVNWTPISQKHYQADSTNGTAVLRLNVDSDTLWVSAQELVTSSWFRNWADSLVRKPFVTRDTAGFSHQQRPIERFTITEAEGRANRGVLIVISRLHPPEVTGNMASYIFLDEIASDSELARKFRKKFEVIAYPFANPDGVYNGHWRHNRGGIDLNRDWEHFNQPETEAIRKDLLASVEADPGKRVYYGLDFHSTNENIFYPINRDINTFPEDFTYHWLDSLTTAYPDIPLSIEPFDTNSPISKNWIHKTFGADALTYEVDDRADRQELNTIARASAQIIMDRLLRHYHRENGAEE